MTTNDQPTDNGGAIVAIGYKIAEAIKERLPEAPASITAKVSDPNGFDLLVTLRADTMNELFKQWRAFSDIMVSNEFFPQGKPRAGAQLPPPPPEPTAAEVEAELNPDMAQASQPQAVNGLTFEAETLAASVNDGKTYWKVKGGQFSKYGVTVWPEVLQAAIQSGALWDIEGELDPLQTYPLSGIIAHYAVNDKGQPSKVTMLQRAA